MIASHHQSRQQRSLLSGAPLGKKGAVNVCSVSAGDKHEKTTNFLITEPTNVHGFHSAPVPDDLNLQQGASDDGN